MPIGKNAIKRVSNSGYSNVQTSAPDMENSVATTPEAPKAEAPKAEAPKVEAPVKTAPKKTAKKTTKKSWSYIAQCITAGSGRKSAAAKPRRSTW